MKKTLLLLTHSGVLINHKLLFGAHFINDHCLAEPFVEALLCVGISMAMLTF